MRTKLTTLATTILAAALAACSAGKTDTAQDDFKRDLQLASATNMNLAAPKVDPKLLTLENAPSANPEPAHTIKKAPGPKAVQSEEPTVEAAPEPEPAAVTEEPTTASTTIAPAPAPESHEPVAVAPRPAPVPATPAGGLGSGDYGSGGGVFGGGIGVIIRGGGIGDGDHCEIRPRRAPVIYRSPVYVPRMGGSSGGVIRLGGR